jgi:hypothetical protein
MVVDDFDIPWSLVTPDETGPPLAVDADAVLPGPVTLQYLQAIAGWRRQITQNLRIMQLPRLAMGDALQIRPDPADETARNSASASRSANVRICMQPAPRNWCPET